MKGYHICETFTRHANRVQFWIEKQENVGEESITDWLLFTISEELPFMHYKKFSRFEEGRITGADWEWWILTNKEHLALRIQAKKLKAGDNYSSISYVSANEKLQIDNLIDNAETQGYLPMYSFYSSFREKNSLFNSLIKCKNKTDKFGVYLSNAYDLKEKIIDDRKRMWSEKDLISFSNPLACLFCCGASLNEKGSFSNLRRYLIQYYFPNTMESSQSHGNNLGFKKYIPGYISAFISEQETKDKIDWEAEYRNILKNTKSLIVLDLRD